MRRETKYVINGALIVAGVVTVGDIILQWLEHIKNGQKFTWENFNGRRTLKNAVIGGIVGGGLGYAYYSYCIEEEEKTPFSSDEYLRKILSKEHLKKNPYLFNEVLQRRNTMKQWLASKFRGDLVSPPEDTGSFYKRTANCSNFDLDIILPFKRNSYNSLEEMYYDVYNVIARKFGNRATITKQTKAIGITFENKGISIHFDIVPGREINNYLKEKDLNLFVRSDWVWQKGSSFKTNITIQKKITTNNPEARDVIRLLKIYRDRNNFDLPTPLIEQCVVAALSADKFGSYSSSTENLLNSMDYLSKKIDDKNVIDIANSNNNLNDKLDGSQKSTLSYQMQNDIQKIEANPRYIKEVFDY